MCLELVKRAASAPDIVSYMQHWNQGDTWRRRETTSWWPCWAAKWRGVSPSFVCHKKKNPFITILFQYGLLINTQVYIMPILLIKHMCNYTLNGVWRYEHARFCVEGFTHLLCKFSFIKTHLGGLPPAHQQYSCTLNLLNIELRLKKMF